MKIWQRNAVVATVALFVAVSVYLSWSYNRTPGEESDLPVYQPQNAAAVTAEQDGLPKQPESNYFAESRLARQRARDSALAILNEAGSRETAAQDIKDQAAVEIQLLAKHAMAEASVEGLIEAKGFADCVAYITNDRISLVVAAPDGGLTAADVTKIKDICLSETNFGIDEITIIEV